MSLDVALALVVAFACAAWLVRRAVRTLRPRDAGSGCGCGKPKAAPCPQAGALADAVRRGARRRATSRSRPPA